MSKRGTRSQKAITRRKIQYTLKQLILQEAWHCKIVDETICTTTHEALRNYGYEWYGSDFSCTFIPDVQDGTVLSDSRGRGAMQ